MSKDTQVLFQEVPRIYRTEIPNIVFEMLEAGLISANDLALYSTYRRIAGEQGACWVGTRGLEKKCQLADKTITKSKKVLSKKFDILGGKSLIEILPCDRKKEQADTVMIIDIWHENFAFFKNKLTCSKRGDGGVVNGGTPVSYSRRHKKEPDKNEHKETIEPPKSKPLPAGGNYNTFYKSLDRCVDLSDRQKQMLMKYPEHSVNEAVRYCYHATTQIKGGPIGRIKLLQYFLQNPANFSEQMKSLDKPPVTQSKKDIILGIFKRGQMYNGYEFIQDDVGVGFYRPGHPQPHSIRWDALNFAPDFLDLLKKLGIKHE